MGWLIPAVGLAALLFRGRSMARREVRGKPSRAGLFVALLGGSILVNCFPIFLHWSESARIAEELTCVEFQALCVLLLWRKRAVSGGGSVLD